MVAIIAPKHARNKSPTQQLQKQKQSKPYRLSCMPEAKRFQMWQIYKKAVRELDVIDFERSFVQIGADSNALLPRLAQLGDWEITVAAAGI